MESEFKLKYISYCKVKKTDGKSFKMNYMTGILPVYHAVKTKRKQNVKKKCEKIAA